MQRVRSFFMMWTVLHACSGVVWAKSVNGAPQVTPSPSPSPCAGISDSCPAVFESLVSVTPKNFIVANPVSYPQSARLKIVGTSPDHPGYRVQAHVKLLDLGPLSSRWEVISVEQKNLPPGLAPIEFVEDHSFNMDGYHYPYLLVKHSGGPWIRMKWQITGTSTSDVAPVLLPSKHTTPWLGVKRGWVVKVRDTEHDRDSDESYFGKNNIMISKLLRPVMGAIERMSNGATQMSYGVKEVDVKVPEESLYDIPFRKSYLSQLGADGVSGRRSFDWIIHTLYPETRSLLTPLPNQPNGSSAALTSKCPGCGPGALFPNLYFDGRPYRATFDETQISPSYLLHEFGHGISVAGQHPSVNTHCETGTPDLVTDRHLFYACQRPSDDPVDNMSLGLSRGLWWGPIERAGLGWLKGSQVKMVTASGVYTLYSDRNDFTSEPDQPLILQIPVMLEGRQDELYIQMSNTKNVQEVYPSPWMSKEREHLQNGVQIFAVAAESRAGLGRASNTLREYSFYNSTQDTSQAIYYASLQPEQEVVLKWNGTHLAIKVLSRVGRRSRIEVRFLSL